MIWSDNLNILSNFSKLFDFNLELIVDLNLEKNSAMKRNVV